MDDSLIFFPDVFDQKKRLRRIPVGMGVVAFQRGKKQILHSQPAIALSDQHRSQGKKMNSFHQIFSAELGQGTGVCTLVCNVHASCSAALTVLSYEHRSFILTNTASMYLGSD